VFTGIIRQQGKILRTTGTRVWATLGNGPAPVHGASVAVNGVCLTIAEINGSEVAFDVVAETLRRTTLGEVKIGQMFHVEHSLKVGDPLDGHMVQGHVDGVCRVVQQRDGGGEWRTRLRVEGGLSKYLVPQGSVTLDGVSLTIALIEGNEFEVALIPTTRQLTHLADSAEGAAVNIECDAMVKTIVAVIERMKNET